MVFRDFFNQLCNGSTAKDDSKDDIWPEVWCVWPEVWCVWPEGWCVWPEVWCVWPEVCCVWPEGFHVVPGYISGDFLGLGRDRFHGFRVSLCCACCTLFHVFAVLPIF